MVAGASEKSDVNADIVVALLEHGTKRRGYRQTRFGDLTSSRIVGNSEANPLLFPARPESAGTGGTPARPAFQHLLHFLIGSKLAPIGLV